MAKLRDVIERLQAGRPLPATYRDHKLQGAYRDRRECHRAFDLLLLYKATGSEVILERIGSHAQLFD